jgi:predicted N-acetyltransferase YhbS
MRVLPSHQGKGLGSLLLKWRLEEARKQKRKVFLSASPQGRYLYSKHGFQVVGEVNMRIRDYLDDEEWGVWCKERKGLREEEREKEEVYVQSFMVWDPEETGRE